MKIVYENKWEKAVFHADMEIPYKEDYQMQMLERNAIGCLLKVTGSGRDGQSRYSFHTGEFVSMEKEYGRKEMKKEDVEQFTMQLMAAVKEVREYLLNPDQIVLVPEFIFVRDGTYRFCYLPQTDLENQKPLCVSFHELTEYFIRKLDHRDTEGIFLVYKLHRETFKDSYDLGKILEAYREEKYVRREKEQAERIDNNSVLSEGAVFYAAEEDEEENDGEEKTENEKDLTGWRRNKEADISGRLCRESGREDGDSGRILSRKWMDRGRGDIYNEIDHKREKVIDCETKDRGCVDGNTDLYKCSCIFNPVCIREYGGYAVHAGAWGGIRAFCCP